MLLCFMLRVQQKRRIKLTQLRSKAAIAPDLVCVLDKIRVCPRVVCGRGSRSGCILVRQNTQLTDLSNQE